MTRKIPEIPASINPNETENPVKQHVAKGYTPMESVFGCIPNAKWGSPILQNRYSVQIKA